MATWPVPATKLRAFMNVNNTLALLSLIRREVKSQVFDPFKTNHQALELIVLNTFEQYPNTNPNRTPNPNQSMLWFE